MQYREHTHEGPRTGQTDDDKWIMTCQTCGVSFVEGLEDMEKETEEEMMELLFGGDRG